MFQSFVNNTDFYWLPFIQELREAFELEAQQTKKDRLLITMAVTASLEYAAQAYDIPSLDQVHRLS